MTVLDHRHPGKWVMVAWCAMLVWGCESARGPSAPSIVPSQHASSETTSPKPPAPQSPQPVPRAIVTGEYEVTFSAQNCNQLGRPLLPKELRTRTFLLRVEQTGADIWVLAEALPWDPMRYGRALWGHLDSDGHVALTNYYGNDQWDPLWDQVTPERSVLILVESMRVAISTEGLLSVGKFAGYFESRLDKTVIESDCVSTTHSVTFIRRGTSHDASAHGSVSRSHRGWRI